MDEELFVQNPVVRRLSYQYFCLSNLERCYILWLLAQQPGGMKVQELINLVRVKQCRISFHMRVLKDAGFVVERREGHFKVYTLNFEKSAFAISSISAALIAS